MKFQIKSHNSIAAFLLALTASLVVSAALSVFSLHLYTWNLDVYSNKGGDTGWLREAPRIFSLLRERNDRAKVIFMGSSQAHYFPVYYKKKYPDIETLDYTHGGSGLLDAFSYLRRSHFQTNSTIVMVAGILEFQRKPEEALIRQKSVADLSDILSWQKIIPAKDLWKMRTEVCDALSGCLFGQYRFREQIKQLYKKKTINAVDASKETSSTKAASSNKDPDARIYKMLYSNNPTSRMRQNAEIFDSITDLAHKKKCRLIVIEGYLKPSALRMPPIDEQYEVVHEFLQESSRRNNFTLISKDEYGDYSDSDFKDPLHFAHSRIMVTMCNLIYKNL